MSNNNKAKGSRAELEVARYMQTAGWPYAERAYGAGRHDDRGDITGAPGIVIEVKNQKQHALPKWLTELEQEIDNARAVTGVLVVKRRLHTNPADWYAITRFADWCHLAKDAGL